MIMFDIIRQSLKTGVVTTSYPDAPPLLSPRARGRPEIDWANWKDARPAAAACPTGAISFEDAGAGRTARLDLAKCVFCGLCAETAPEIRMSNVCECAARRREDLVVLDRIGNAHNLGAIARSAAYFGVERIVIAGDPASARPGAAAYRVAEGGLEAVEIWTVPDVAPFLRALSAAGYEVVGAAARGGSDPDTAPGREAPWALVLGNEEHGLADEVRAACTRLVTIPGSGRVESLNVSAAAAVLIRGLGRRGHRRQDRSM